MAADVGSLWQCGKCVPSLANLEAAHRPARGQSWLWLSCARSCVLLLSFLVITLLRDMPTDGTQWSEDCDLVRHWCDDDAFSALQRFTRRRTATRGRRLRRLGHGHWR